MSFAPTERATQVAVVAQTAIATGARTGHAVATHFGITPAAAKMAIRHARKLGYAIPFTHPAHCDRPPPPPKVVIAGAVLTCDCGHTIALADWQPGEQLIRHCITEHRRRPHTHERTPSPSQQAAA